MNSAENNKAVSRNFIESYNQKDLDKSFNDYISMDLINHSLGGSLPRQSIFFGDAFSDALRTVKQTINNPPLLN